jgi:SNF2 family DNA or RNA helicase
LTIRAGGVGINLFRAWLMLFVDRDWSPGLNDQMECRIVRIGQTADKVQIVQMTSRHPLEIHILKLLGKKQRMIHAAIEQDVI